MQRNILSQDVVQLLTMLSAVINIGDVDFVATGNNDNAKVSNDVQLTKGVLIVSPVKYSTVK